jgi:hypothetical protein
MNGDAASNPLNKEVRMAYIDDHPTNFIWTPHVAQTVARLQAKYPWRTYINTYWDHPPLPNVTDGFYDEVSFDVWGGGRSRITGKYLGYRGKPLPRRLGNRIFKELFYGNYPEIDWIIWQGRMWWNPATGGPGWTVAPAGAADSDPGHFGHIHWTGRR